jgi:hypothetical protein
MRTKPDEAQRSSEEPRKVLLQWDADCAREMESRCLRRMPVTLSDTLTSGFIVRTRSRACMLAQKRACRLLC